MGTSAENALKAMEGVVRSEHVITGPKVLNAYSVNMLGVDNIMPAAVMRPGSVEEIQAILRIATENRTPVWALTEGPYHKTRYQ
ncbi:MAG: hypothetical protein ABSC19_09665 [Syntrophorhabdales bacterium]|jgi:FAD/FMN-containing dehydrogenase